MGRRETKLGQHAHRVEHRGRLDHPGQHELEERLVGDDVEPEVPPRPGHHIDEQARGLRLDDRDIGVLLRTQVEVENPLAFLDLAAPDLDQGCELGLGVCRAEVLDHDVATVLLAGDLHSGRTRRRLDLPHEHHARNVAA